MLRRTQRGVAAAQIIGILLIVFLIGLLKPASNQSVQATSAEPQKTRSVLSEKLRRARQGRERNRNVETQKIAGLSVAVWRPREKTPAPLIVFSHGLNGCNTQSRFLMEALADDGYLLVSANHKDAVCENRGPSKPEESLRSAQSWTERTYEDRKADINKLLDALRADRTWSSQIDWNRIAFAGHSLGGYTGLALAGAWPSWKRKDIKTVLALSPYCEPFVQKGNLAVGIPVMYQGGTRDLGITPSVKKPNGCFSKTSRSAYFVEFQSAGHFAWTDAVKDQHELIVHYSLEFLDKHLRGNTGARPEAKLTGVTDLRVK
jgi:predicted dienelactone hydrolase